MNQNEIIAMAKEAGGYESPQYPGNLVMDEHDLGRFAAQARFPVKLGNTMKTKTEWLDYLGFYLEEQQGVWMVIDELAQSRTATMVERVLWDALMEQQT